LSTKLNSSKTNGGCTAAMHWYVTD
jgi:hypothetical protein